MNPLPSTEREKQATSAGFAGLALGWFFPDYPRATVLTAVGMLTGASVLRFLPDQAPVPTTEEVADKEPLYLAVSLAVSFAAGIGLRIYQEGLAP